MSGLADLVPWRIRVRTKKAYQHFQYVAGTCTGLRDPLIPPAYLHDIGGTDHKAVGDEFLGHFVNLAGLKPTERVLDVGCGTGRIARPLTKFLNGGSYDGIDIVRESIDWCSRVYQRYPGFRFHFSDIYNKLYNPTGPIRSSEYRLPFEPSSFDFVFLGSVFTHMLADDMEHYLSEITRVLKPGGRSIITYFLINPESSQLINDKISPLLFAHPVKGCRLEMVEMPEYCIAYDETRVRELYRQYGLTIMEPIRYGSWCARKNWSSYQDLVVATKN